MKTKANLMNPPGLIGGMSWESTVPYDQQITQSVKARLGGLHSARIILALMREPKVIAWATDACAHVPL